MPNMSETLYKKGWHKVANQAQTVTLTLTFDRWVTIPKRLSAYETMQAAAPVTKVLPPA